jgi:hypothetical protein
MGSGAPIGDRLSFGKQPGLYQHGNMMPFYLHNTFQFYTSLQGPKRAQRSGLVTVLSSVQCLLEYISQCTVALEKDETLAFDIDVADKTETKTSLSPKCESSENTIFYLFVSDTFCETGSSDTELLSCIITILTNKMSYLNKCHSKGMFFVIRFLFL